MKTEHDEQMINEKEWNEYKELTKEYTNIHEQLRRRLERKELLLENAVELIEDREKEIEQLRNQLEKATNERNTFRDYLAITVQTLSIIEETLGKQKIMNDALLWSVYTEICKALSQTKEECFNWKI